MSAPQVVLQTPLLSQMNALQDEVAPAWQVPAPSHLPAAVATPAAQVFVPQVVPEAYSRQPPLPSQNPSVLQLVIPWSAHCASGS